jgi:hypothetical protein
VYRNNVKMTRTYQHDPRSKKYMKPNQNDLKNAIMAIKSKQSSIPGSSGNIWHTLFCTLPSVKFIIFKLQFMLYSYQFLFV